MRSYMVEQVQWDKVLSAPEYFLCGLNFEERQFEFLKSSRDQLSEPAFIDGRMSLSNSISRYRIPMEQAISWHQSNTLQKQPNNFIFHMGFCGSTLMARSLNFSGKCFSYKEPQAFIHASELHLVEDLFFHENRRSITSFILGQYSIPWSRGENSITKPSNWVNSMLPELISDVQNTKAVFLSIKPEDFLVAVFRGGEPRIQYVLNFLKHINTAVPEYHDVIQKIEHEEKNKIVSFIKLTLVAHTIQRHMFLIGSNTLPKQNQASCSYEQFIKNPNSTLVEVAKLFELNLTNDNICHIAQKNLSKHSKNATREYDRKTSEVINQQVIGHYAEEFENGLRWYRSQLI